MAADRYWVGGTASWNDANNWAASSGGAGGAGVPTSSDAVYFDATSAIGNPTVTIDVDYTVASLDCTGYSATLLDGGFTLTVAGAVTLDASMTYTATGTLELTATSAPVTLTSGGQQLYILQLAPANGVTLSGACSVDNLIWATTGSVALGGDALTLRSGDLTRSDVTGVEGTQTISSNVVLGANGAWAINSSDGALVVSGVVSDGGNTYSLEKTGAGSLSLSGANTYAGATTVSGGTLVVKNGSGSGTGTGAVTVASGATLAGTGSMSGLVTVADGGDIAPGDGGTGTLSCAGGLSSNATSACNLELGTSSDRIDVTGALTLDGVLNVTAGAGFTTTTYTLATYSSLTDNGLEIGSMPAGYGGTISNDGSNVMLTVYAISDHVWTGAGDGTTWADQGNWRLEPSDGSNGNDGYPDGADDTATLAVAVGGGAIRTPGVLTLGALTLDDPFDGTLHLAGALTLSNAAGNSGSLTMNGTTGAYTFSLQDLDASTRLMSLNGSWTKTAGTFTSGLGSVTFDGTGAVTLESGGSDDGSDFNDVVIAKTGGGSVTVQTDAWDVDGTVSVNSGTLLINSASTITGGATVVSGASLGGTNTINGAVTVQDGGDIAPGDGGTGTLTINGNLVMQATSASTWTMELGTSSDQIVIDGNLTLDGIVNVSDSGGFTATTYIIATYTGTLTDNTLRVGSLPTGYDATISASDGSVTLTVRAVDYIWDGGGDGTSWTDPLNWMANSGYPDDGGDSVAITTGSATITTPGSAISIGRLRLGSGFSGTLSLAAVLDLDNDGGYDGMLDCSGFSGTLDQNTHHIEVEGDVILGAGMSLVANDNSTRLILDDDTQGQTLTSNGVIIPELFVENEVRVDLLDAVQTLDAIKVVPFGAGNATATLWTNDHAVTIGGDLAMGNPNWSTEYGVLQAGDSIITIGDDLVIGEASASGNQLILAGATISVGDDLELPSGSTVTAGTSTITCTLSADGAGVLTSGGSTFHHFLVDDGAAGGTMVLADALDVDGDLTVTSGTLDSAGFAITCAGDWSNSDNFTAGAGTVTFDGAALQAVTSGSSAWNDLLITNASVGGVTFADAFTCADLSCTTAGATITLPAGVASTLTGDLVLSGSSASEITLQSSSAGTAFQLAAAQAEAINEVNIIDGDASAYDILVRNGTDTSSDSGDVSPHFVFVSGYDFIWTGADRATNTDWSNQANWDSGDGTPGDDGYPDDSNDTALIDSSGDAIGTPGSALAIGGLTLTNGFTGTLTLNASLTLDDGTGASGAFIGSGFTGTLAAGSNDVLVDGTVTFGSAMTLSGTGAWYLSGDRPQTLTSNGINAYEIRVISPGGVDLVDDLSVTNRLYVGAEESGITGVLRSNDHRIDIGGDLIIGLSGFPSAYGILYANASQVVVGDDLRFHVPTAADGNQIVFTTGSFSVGDDFDIKGTGCLFDAGSSTTTITVVDDAATLLSNGITFHHLVVNDADGGGTLALLDALDVDGDLTVTSGTLDSAGFAITCAGDWSNSDAFTAGTGTVTLDGTALQTVTSGGSAWNDLVITNASAGGVTFADAFTCADLSCTTAGATLSLPAGAATTITGGLDLTGTSASEITLQSSSAGTSFQLATAQIESVDEVTVIDGDASAYDIYVRNGTETSSDSAEASPHFVFVSGYDYVWTGANRATNTDWSNQANWDSGDGTPGDDGYPDDASDRATIASSADAIATPGPLTIGKLDLTDAFTGSLTLAGDLTCVDAGLGGSITLAGTALAYTVDTGSYAVNCDGSWTLSGGQVLAGTTTFTVGSGGTGNFLIADTNGIFDGDQASVVLAGSGNVTIPSFSTRVKNLTQANGVDTRLVSGVNVLGGTLVTGDGSSSIFTDDNAQLSLRSLTSFIHNQPVWSGGSGAVEIRLRDSALPGGDYGASDLSNQFGGDFTLAGDVITTGQVSITNGGVQLDIVTEGHDLTCGGVLIGDDGFYINVGAVLDLTSNSALTVTGDIHVVAGDGSVTRALRCDAGSISLIGAGGNWTIEPTAIFDAQLSTVTFDAAAGAGSYTITSAAQPFHHLVINDGTVGADWTLQDALDVDGDLTLSSGTLVGNAQAMTVAGSWTKTGGTFTSGLNTVTFDGGGAVTLESGGTDDGSDFNDVVIAKSGGGSVTVQTDDWDVDGTVTVSSGSLILTSSSTIFGGATVASGASLGGTSTVNGAVAVQDGGGITPGVGGVGTLSINGNLTMAATSSSTWTLELGTSSDQITVGGDLTLDGVLEVSDSGGFGAGTYTIATYTGSLNDQTMTVGTLPAGFVASIDTATANQVQLLVASEPSVSLTATDASAAEPGTDTGTWTLSLSSAVPVDTVVGLGYGGTATDSDDYLTPAAAATIAAGETTTTVALTVVNDYLLDAGETVVATLQAGTGYTVGAPASDTVTIADNDWHWLSDADGLWSDVANWSPASVPSGVDVDVVFTDVLTADRTVTVDQNVTLGGMALDAAGGNYFFADDGTRALTFNRSDAAPEIMALQAAGFHNIDVDVAITSGQVLNVGTIEDVANVDFWQNCTITGDATTGILLRAASGSDANFIGFAQPLSGFTGSFRVTESSEISPRFYDGIFDGLTVQVEGPGKLLPWNYSSTETPANPAPRFANDWHFVGDTTTADTVFEIYNYEATGDGIYHLDGSFTSDALTNGLTFSGGNTSVDGDRRWYLHGSSPTFNGTDRLTNRVGLVIDHPDAFGAGNAGFPLIDMARGATRFVETLLGDGVDLPMAIEIQSENGSCGDARLGCEVVGGTASYSGTIELNSNDRSAARNIRLYAATDARVSFDGVISDNSSGSPQLLTCDGPGSIVLTAANTYPGTTSVASGTLVVANGSGSATGTGAVSVASGATLAGTGSVAGSVSLGDGAILAPGDGGVGTLSLNGGLAMTATSSSQWRFELGSASDQVTVDGNLTIDGQLVVLDAGDLTTGTYTIATYTGSLNDQGLVIASSSAAGFDYALDTSVGGQVRVVVSAESLPTLSTAVTGDGDGDGQIDVLTLTFSEAIDDWSVEAGDFSCGAGYTVAGVDSGATADDAVIRLLLNESGSPDSDATPSVSYAASGSLDLVSAVDGDAVSDFSGAASSDGALPVLLSAVGTVDSDAVAVSFSEPVWSAPGASGALAVADLVYADGSGAGASALASVSETDGSDGAVAARLDVAAVLADFGSDSLAAASGAIYDAAGNTAATTAVPLTDSDTTAPTVTTRTTVDADGDGRIDGIALVFDDAMIDSSLLLGDWSVAGYTITAIATGATADDGEVTLLLNESGSADSGVLPGVQYSGTTATDSSGNALVAEGAAVTPSDGAAPVLLAAIGTVGGTTVQLQFSEAVDSSSSGTADLVSGDFLYSDTASGGAAGIAGLSEADGADGVVSLITDAALALADFGSDTVAAAATAIFDAADNAAGTTAVALIDSDTTPPVILARRTVDADGDGQLDAVELVFDDAMRDSSFLAGAFSVAGYTITGVSTGATADDATVLLALQESGSADSGATPLVQYSGTTATDTSGNAVAAEASGTAAIDGAAPVLLSAVGTVGATELVLTFSEAVDSSNAGSVDLASGDLLYSDASSDGATALASVSEADGADRQVSVTLDGPAELSDFGVDTLAAASAQIYDAANNAAASLAVVLIDSDTTAPTFLSRSTDDADADGQIDGILLVFDDAMADGSILPAEWSVAGYTISGVDTADTADDAVILLQLTASGSPDTAATPAVQYSGTSATDSSGNALASEASATAAADGAPPILLGAVTTVGATAVTLSFSEPVDSQSGGSAAVTSGDLLYGDHAAGAATAIAAVDDGDGSDGVLTISLDAAVALSDIGSDTLAAVANEIFDAVDLAAPSAVAVALSDSDSSPPSLLTRTTIDADSDGRIDAIELVFDDDLDDSSFTSSGWSVVGCTVTGTSTGTTAGDGTLRLLVQEATSADSGARPLVEYGGSSLRDSSGNLFPAESSGTAASDGAAPVLLSVRGTASSDQLLLRFSEAVGSLGDGSGVLATTDLSYVNNASGGATAIASFTDADGSDGLLTVTLDAAAVADDFGADAVAAIGSQVFDAAGLVAGTAAVFLVDTDTDGPAITLRQTRDADGDGLLDGILLRFDEPILDTNAEAADFVVAGHVVHGLSTGSTADDAELIILFDEAATPDTGTTPGVRYRSSGSVDLTDLSGNPLPDDPGAQASSDGAAPVLLTAVTTVGATAIELTFSEALGGSVASSDVQFIDSNASGAGALAGVSEADGSDRVVTVTVAAAVALADIGSDSLAATGGQPTDVVGNAALTTAVLLTDSDSSAPTLLARTTRDADGNGQIDALVLVFDDAMADSSFGSGAGWSVTGYTITGVVTDTAVDDATLSLQLQESGSPDSGATPAVLYDGSGVVTDRSGNALAAEASASAAADGAVPVLLRATSTVTSSTVAVGWSEAVRGSGGAAVTASDLQWIDANGGAGASAVVGLVDADGGDGQLRLSTDQALVIGDFTADAVAAASGGILDAAGNAAAAAVQVEVVDTNTLAPSLLARTTVDADGDGFIDGIALQFNEPIQDSTVAIADFTVSDGYQLSGIATGATADDDQLTLLLQEQSVPDTAATPTLRYQADGSDGGATDLQDLSGNALPDDPAPVTSSDGAAPVLLSVHSTRGQTRLHLDCSEPVGDAGASSGADLAPVLLTSFTFLDGNGAGATSLVQFVPAVDGGGGDDGSDGHLDLGLSPVLVSGDFAPAVDADQLQVQSGRLVDAVGLGMPATTRTLSDDGTTVPQITDRQTRDRDADGWLDAIELTLDAAVLDSSFNAAVAAGSFTVAGGWTITGADSGATADDAQVFLLLAAGTGSGSGVSVSGDTAATPSLSYQPTDILDPATQVVHANGNQLLADSTPVTSTDGAGPALVAARTLTTTTVAVTASEPLADASLAVSDVTFSGFATGGANAVAAGIATGATADDAAVVLTLPATIGADETGLLAFVSHQVASDRAVVPVGNTQTAAIPVTDGIAPAPTLSGGRTGDADGDGRIDRLTLFFTAPVLVTDASASDALPGLTVAGATVAAGAYGTGAAGGPATAASSLTLVLTEAADPDSGLRPTLSYAGVSAGRFQAPTTGALVPSVADLVAADGAAPVLVAAVGQIGETGVELTASEGLQGWGSVDPATGLAAVRLADLLYQDISGGDAATLAAVAETDGSDGTIAVSLTSALALADVGVDRLGAPAPSGAAGLRDASGNAMAAQSQRIVERAALPGLDPIADQYLREDSGSSQVALAGIRPSTIGTSVSLRVSSSQPAVLPQPSLRLAADGSGTGMLYLAPAPNAFGNATVTIRVSDDSGASLTRSFQVSVAPVNDAPQLTAPADQSLHEDDPAIALTVTGLAAGPANEADQHLSLSVLSLHPTVVPTPSLFYTPGATTATITLQPAAEASGTATILVTAGDDGGTADGGRDQRTRSFQVTVAAVNDAPVLVLNTGLSVPVGERRPLGPNRLAASDDGGAAQIFYTLGNAPAAGQLQRAGAQLLAGDTFSQADLEAGLIAYDHLGTLPTTETIGLTLVDGGGAVGTTFSVTITAELAGIASAPPVFDPDRGTVAWQEGGGPVQLAADLQVIDSDGDVGGGLLQVDVLAGGDGNDVLALVVAASGLAELAYVDGVISYAGRELASTAAGASDISGLHALQFFLAADASATDVARILSCLVFDHTTAAPPTADRTVRFRLDDGTGTAAAPAERTVTIATVNDPPAIAVVDPIQTLEEDGAAVAVVPQATITDADSADLAGGRFDLVWLSSPVTADQLQLVTDYDLGVSLIGDNVVVGGSIVALLAGGADGTDLQLTWQSGATPAVATQVVRALQLQTTAETTTASIRQLELRCSDGDGGDAEPITVALTVLPVNDAPALAAGDSTAAVYTERGPGIAVADAATVADVDSNDFGGGLISAAIVAGAAPADRLAIQTSAGLLGAGNLAGVSVSGHEGHGGEERSLLARSLVGAGSGHEGHEEDDGHEEGGRYLYATAVTGFPGVPSSSSTPATTAVIGEADPLADPTPAFFTAAATVADLRLDDDGSLSLSDRLLGQVSGSGSVENPLRVALADGVTAADTALIVQAIHFLHDSTDPGEQTRLVAIQLSDGDGGSSQPLSVAVNVVSINLAPTVTITAGTRSYTENDEPLLLVPDAQIADVDSPDFAGGRLVISRSGPSPASLGGQPGDDVLGFSTGDGLILDGNQALLDGAPLATGSLTGSDVLLLDLSKAATPATLTRLLRRLHFTHSGDHPAESPRTIQIVLDDGDGDSSTPVQLDLTVQAVEDPAAAADLTLGSMIDLPVRGTLQGSDPEGASLAYQLLVAPDHGQIVDFDSTTGFFTYQPDGTTGIASAHFTYQVADGTTTSTPATVTIHLTDYDQTRLHALTDPPDTTFIGAAFDHQIRLVADDGSTPACDVQLLAPVPAGLYLERPADDQIRIRWPTDADGPTHRAIHLLFTDRTTHQSGTCRILIPLRFFPQGES